MLINTQWSVLTALIIFIAASLTDMLDGMMARKYNLITDFGKFLDPLADKILTISAFICMMAVSMGISATFWAIYISTIMIREFTVTSLRLTASAGGKVIAADKLGKYKTVSQMIFIIISLLSYVIFRFCGKQMSCTALSIIYFLMGLSLALTIVSGLNYLIKNRTLLKEK